MKAFGKGARIQQPSWGFVALGVSVKDVKLTPEAMASTAAELQRQNASTWGADKAEITHPSWLTRPREKQYASKLVIEVTNPLVANKAIRHGVICNGQIHAVTILCREGRSKQCLRRALSREQAPYVLHTSSRHF